MIITHQTYQFNTFYYEEKITKKWDKSAPGTGHSTVPSFSWRLLIERSHWLVPFGLKFFLYPSQKALFPRKPFRRITLLFDPISKQQT